jgi:lysozyme
MIRSALEAILLVLSYEQLRLKPYDDGVGVLTIGWGHRILPNEKDLLAPAGISRERANGLFISDFERHESFVLAALDFPNELSPLQLGACTSLCFNIGGGAFSTSSVVRRINGRVYHLVPDAFRMWNKGRVKGVLKELGGLTARRESEVALWLRGFGTEANQTG